MIRENDELKALEKRREEKAQEEAKRIAAQAAERQKEATRKEDENIKLRAALASDGASKLKIKEEDLKTLGADAIKKKIAEQQEKEQKDLLVKVCTQHPFMTTHQTSYNHRHCIPMVGRCLGPGTTLGYHRPLQREAQALNPRSFVILALLSTKCV